MEPNASNHHAKTEIEVLHVTDRSPVKKVELYTTEWELHDDCICQLASEAEIPVQSKNEDEVPEKERPIKVS